MSMPSILGREMRHVGTRSFILEFGPISARIQATGHLDRYDADCACRVLVRSASLPECVAAIEKELTDIRDAIPTQKALERLSWVTPGTALTPGKWYRIMELWDGDPYPTRRVGDVLRCGNEPTARELGPNWLGSYWLGGLKERDGMGACCSGLKEVPGPKEQP